MKSLFILLMIGYLPVMSFSQADSLSQQNTVDINKEIARNFYQDLWQTNNTDNYSKYVADEYIVHDIGDRKGVKEPAKEQKLIADMFWANGSNKVTIDYQIAEGDLVATRWIFDYEPESIFGKVVFGTQPIPIINVFRIVDGKIVEIWNHRHDIDTNQTIEFTLKGLLIGLIIALVPTILALRMRRKIKKLTTQKT